MRDVRQAVRAMGMAVLALGLLAPSTPLAAEPDTPAIGASPSGPGLVFPQDLGSFKFKTQTDFETGSPGLGWGAKYADGASFMDVYVYTHSQTSIPDDAASEVVQHELETAKSDIFRAKKLGAWSKVEEKSAFASSDGDLKFQCVAFELEQPQASTPWDSFLCLKGWKGKFFKIRLSMPRSEESGAKAKNIALAWANYLKVLN